MASAWARDTWLTIGIVAILTATFLTDAFTPRGVAAGVFPYFFAVFLSGWLRSPHTTVAPFLVAGIASVLCVAGFLVTEGGRAQIIIVNRTFIVGTIWLMAILAYWQIRTNAKLTGQLAETESRKKFHDLVVNAKVGIQISAGRARRSFVNQALVDMLGYDSIEEYLAPPQRQIVAGHDRPFIVTLSTVQNAKTPLPDFYEFDAVKKDGSFIRLRAVWQLIDWEGEPSILRMLFDVSDRERALRALAESEQRFRNLIEHGRVAMSISFGNGERALVNRALVEMLGYDSIEEFMALPAYSIPAPHERDRYVHQDEETLGGRSSSSIMEFDALRKDGTICRLWTEWQKIQWEGRDAIFRILIDFTARDEAQRALAESEKRYRSLIEGSQLGMQISYPDGRRRYVNRRFLEMFGYDSFDDLLAVTTYGGLVAPHDRAWVMANQKARGRGESVPRIYSYDAMRKDGTIMPVEVFVTDLIWDGEPSFLRVFVDKTEQRKVEEQARGALQENEERQRLILDSLEDGVFGVDIPGNCTFINRAGVKLLGYSDPVELVGKNLHDLIHHSHPDGTPYSREECQITRARRRGEGTETDNEIFWRADGTSFPVALRTRPIYKDGASVGNVVTFCDLTRRQEEKRLMREREKMVRDLQNELSRAERISAMGEISTIIAHELHQPLAAISNTANAVRRQFNNGAVRDTGQLKEMIQLICDQSQQAGQVVQRTRSLFEKGPSERKPEDLNSVVREACALLTLEYRSNDVRINVKSDRTAPQVLIDRLQIQQVIYNLLRNAIDSTRGIQMGEISVCIEAPDEGKAAIIVSDNGSGISPEMRNSLFDPFTTTKEKGMGVGLYTCRTIVEAHGGEISAEPNDGPGTVFRVTLPRAA